MRILHTEASNGWGGQEMRILQESQGMRSRGHKVFFAVTQGGRLAEKARLEGFQVVELPFQKTKALSSLWILFQLIRKQKIQVIITHSSLDAWIAGVSARLSGVPVIRTRHLSAAIRPGLNSTLLYRGLADRVVTTCEEIAGVIRKQARRSIAHCRSIPTGVNPSKLQIDPKEVIAFRESLGIAPEHLVLGTLCVLRSWKGIDDFIEAANLLKNLEHVRWLVVGSGPLMAGFQEMARNYALSDKIIFTGYLENPACALAAMDVFLLLSVANEGVSQSSLQAAYLEKPLITTTVGGLTEVCIHGQTGLNVPPKNPNAVAGAARSILANNEIRRAYGRAAKELVESRFLLAHTLDAMEEMISDLRPA